MTTPQVPHIPQVSHFHDPSAATAAVRARFDEPFAALYARFADLGIDTEGGGRLLDDAVTAYDRARGDYVDGDPLHHHYARQVAADWAVGCFAWDDYRDQHADGLADRWRVPKATVDALAGLVAAGLNLRLREAAELTIDRDEPLLEPLRLALVAARPAVSALEGLRAWLPGSIRARRRLAAATRAYVDVREPVDEAHELLAVLDGVDGGPRGGLSDDDPED